MARKIKDSIIHYNETLMQLMHRFPELKAPIEKHSKKLSKNSNYSKIIVGMTYSSRDGYPSRIGVRYECYEQNGKESSYKFILNFVCKWKEE